MVKSQAGFVLIYVLWITVAVMGLAFILSRHGREITHLERVYETRLSLQNELFSLRKVAVTFLRKGNMVSPTQAKIGHCHIYIYNASSFLPLNATTSEELYRLCRIIGISKKQADIIADSLMDWRDSDSMVRPHGAEDGYYQSLIPPYHCANRDFATIRELLLVRGITKEVAERLDQYVTPYSREINFNYAPLPVIYAVCGDMAIARNIIEFRRSDILDKDSLRVLVGEHLYEKLLNRYTFEKSSYHRLIIIASEQNITLEHHEWLKGK